MSNISADGQGLVNVNVGLKDVSLGTDATNAIIGREIVIHGDDADYRTDKRHSIVIETRKVKRGDLLSIALAPGGGQAIRFKAALGGR